MCEGILAKRREVGGSHFSGGLDTLRPDFDVHRDHGLRQATGQSDQSSANIREAREIDTYRSP